MLRGFGGVRSVQGALLLALVVVAGSANAQPQAYPAPRAPAPAPVPYAATPPPPAWVAAPAPYPAPYPQPYYAAQPAAYPATLPPPGFAPISDLPYAARQQPRAPRPPRVFAWRWMFELGGTFKYGQVEHLVDEEPIAFHASSSDSRSLHGAFDLRLTFQRRFGRWFALAGQLGWTNWQSDFLDNLGRARSNYVALVLQPELRLPPGKCRRCPVLFVAGRVGVALSVRGADQWGHSALEELQLGSGLVYGIRAGLEVPFGDRISLRFSTGYEAAELRNRMDYQGLGSERLAVKIERPSTTLGLAIGLGDGT